MVEIVSPGHSIRLRERLYRKLFRQFVYIHIPKTAGMCIHVRTRNSPCRKRFISMSHAETACSIGRPRRNWTLFASIRNPLAWYVSLYNFKMKSDPDEPVKDYPRMPGNSWPEFFEDIILGRNGPEGFAKWHKPWEPKHYQQEMVAARSDQLGFFSLNFVYYCFADWNRILRQKDIHGHVTSHYAHLVSVPHILRVEHLQEDFNAMVARNGIRVDLTRKVNACAHAPFMDYYSGDMAETVRRKDRMLFKLFGYD